MMPDCIKRLGFVARKDGMSHAGFNKHWMNVHASMVARLPGLLRYSGNLVDRERFPGFDYDGRCCMDQQLSLERLLSDFSKIPST